MIKKTKFQNLDLITSNVDLSGLEVETAGDNETKDLFRTVHGEGYSLNSE